MTRPCNKTFCKNNYAHYGKLKRYGEACMHNKECSMLGIAQRPNVINVLDRPMKDGAQYLPDLTDQELEFCLRCERRVSNKKKLLGEKRRRAS